MTDSVATFLDWLWRATWQASVLAGLVLLLQWTCGKRLSPRWRHALWLLVVVRLVLPVTFESRYSLFSLLPEAPSSRTGLPTLQSEGTQGGIPTDAQPASRVPERSAEPPLLTIGSPSSKPPAARNAWPQFIFAGWLLGAVLVLAYIYSAAIRMARIVRELRPSDDSASVDLLDQTRREIGLRGTPELIETDLVSSPAIFGCMRPRLLLPKGLPQQLTSAELRFVFLHELAHIKRRDVLLSWVTTWVQAIHWFNPIVWLVFRRMRGDREQACDAVALSCTNHGEETAYGETILKLLERYSAPPKVPGVVGILEDRSQLQRRILMISRYRTSVYWTAGAPLLLLSMALISWSAPVRRGADNGNRLSAAGGAVVLGVDTPITQEPQASGPRRVVGTGSAILLQVDGSVPVRDGQLEDESIDGYIDLDPSGADPDRQGILPAKGEFRVPVRSLTGVSEDGRPTSTQLDDSIYLKLKEIITEPITYRVRELTLKEAPKGGSWIFESSGNLTVAGVEAQLTTPVDIALTSEGLKLRARIIFKPSDFRIDLPTEGTAQSPLELAATVSCSARVAGPPASQSQPIAVGFLGYTNGLGASLISNNCNRTVRVWASAWIEIEPFEDARSNDWIWVIGDGDRYLKPGESFYWTFTPPGVTGRWRLRIPWSEGSHAELRDWSRWHNIVGPASTWVAPEYYAASAVVPE